MIKQPKMKNNSTQKNNWNLALTLGLFISIILCATLTSAINERTINLNILVQPSASSGLDVIMLKPNSGKYGASSAVPIEFVLSYNYSMTVACNLSVDDNLIYSFSTSNGMTVSTTRQTVIGEGTHSVKVKCNNGAIQKETIPQSFTTDFTVPQIIIMTQNSTVSYTNSINLSYMAIDTSSPLNCYVMVYDADTNQIKQTLSMPTVTNAQTQQATFNALGDASYTWNVSCSDDSFNTAGSAYGTFTIDMMQNTGFSVTSDKSSYKAGDSAVVVINALPNTYVNLIVSAPVSGSTIRNFTGPYPIVTTISISEAGKYQLRGIASLSGRVFDATANFTSTSNLEASIDVNKTSFGINEPVRFLSDIKGETGTVTVTWKFDDRENNDATGMDVSHTFTRVGTYDVVMTATDATGVKIQDDVSIRVENRYLVKINVVDADNGDVQKNARVVLDGEVTYTDNSGYCSFYMNTGYTSLTVSQAGYQSYNNNRFMVNGDMDYHVSLSKTGTSVAVATSTPVQPAAQIQQTNSIANTQITSTGSENTADVQSEQDQIDDTLNDIDNALKTTTIMDSESLAVAQMLNMEGTLQNAKSSVGKLNWDLEHIAKNQENSSDSVISSSKKAIIDSLDGIKDGTIVSIGIVSTLTIIPNYSKKEIEDASMEILKAANIDDKKIAKKFAYQNFLLQSKYKINTKINVVNVEYLSGREEDMTFVVHSVEQRDNNINIPNVNLIVKIPDGLVEDKEVIDLITPAEEIKPNSVFSYSLVNKNQAKYSLKKVIDKSQAAEIKTQVMYDPKKFDPNNFKSGLTGLAIFSAGPFAGNTLVMLEVFVIVLLIAGYICYEFNLFSKIKLWFLSFDKDVGNVNKLLLAIDKALEERDVPKSQELYEKVAVAYKSLPEKKKASLSEVTQHTYIKVVMLQLHELVSKAKHAIKINDIDAARADYEEMQHLYKQLPKKYKATILQKCKAIFDQLSEQLA